MRSRFIAEDIVAMRGRRAPTPATLNLANVPTKIEERRQAEAHYRRADIVAKLACTLVTLAALALIAWGIINSGPVTILLAIPVGFLWLMIVAATLEWANDAEEAVKTAERQERVALKFAYDEIDRDCGTVDWVDDYLASWQDDRKWRKLVS